MLVLFAVAISVTLSISDNHVVADMLLQSPAPSPPAEPPPAPPPPPVEQPPAEPPPAPPVEQAPAEPAPLPPAEPIPAQDQPVQQESTFQSPVSPEGVIAPASPVLPASSQPPPLPEPVQQAPQSEFQEENPGESSDMVLDRVELVDTIVVSGAYIWLCCGIGLFLLIPLVFLFLQIRGQIKMRREDKF